MKRLALAVASVLVLVASPLVSDSAAVEAEPRIPATISPVLRSQLAADPTAAVTTFVRGASTDEVAASVSKLGLPVVGRWDAFGVVRTTATAAQASRLVSAPGVQYLEEDRPLRWLTETSHVATQSEQAGKMTFEQVIPPPPLPDKPGQRKGQHRKQPEPTVVQRGPFDGSGVTIAVVDSGIDGTNPMFIDPATGESKVIRNVKYAGDGPDGANFLDLTEDGNDTDTASMGGHGTHVAGTAGGYHVTTSAGEKLRGAAPGAKLVGISGGQTASMAFALSGLQWVIDNQIPCEGCPPIRVVNNSWGSEGARHDPSSAIALAVNTLVAEGITVVFAAGNDGTKALEVQTAPDSSNPTPGVISVANVDDADAGSRNGPLAATSSKGKPGDARTYPDVAAPGTDIRAACRPTLPVCYLGLDPAPEDTGYYELSGTSMAAPHVAGIVAVLLSASPTLAPADIENILEDTAYRTSRGGPYHPDEVRNYAGTLLEWFNDTPTSANFGHGVVDAAAALAAAVSGTGNVDTTFCAAADGPIAGDQAGDAVTADAYRKAANDPELDIRRVALGWDATSSALTADLTIQTVAPKPGGTSPLGGRFEVPLTRAGTTYTLRVVRNDLGTATAQLLSGTTVVATGAAVVVPGTPGRLQVSLPASGYVKNAANEPVVQPFAAGELLQTGAIFSRRNLVAGNLLVDAADPACPHIVGQGSVPPPAPVEAVPNLPKPAVATTLRPGQTFEWTDTRVGDPSTGYLCGSCAARILELVVPQEGERLTVALAPTGVGDLTVSITDERGRQLAVGTNAAAADLTEPGIYSIQVTPQSVTVQSQYKGKATLGDPAPPPPPPTSVTEPKVSAGQSYSWESAPYMTSSLAGCTSREDPACDRRDIEVIVPEGAPAPRLTIAISAGPADDYDLYVYPPGSTTALKVATEGSDEELVIQNAAPGVYRVMVSPFAVTPGSTYRGTATAS